MIEALVTLGVAAFLCGLGLMAHRAGAGQRHRVVETVTVSQTVTRTVTAGSASALHAALNRGPQPLPAARGEDGAYQIESGL